MAIGIDSSKWKPRKLGGTPAAKIGNIIAVSILSVGFLTGFFYQFSGVTNKYRKAFQPLYSDPIEEVERKQLIASGLTTRTGDQIREVLEEESRPDTPDK